MVRVRKTCLATTAGDDMRSTEEHLALSPKNGRKCTHSFLKSVVVNTEMLKHSLKLHLLGSLISYDMYKC